MIGDVLELNGRGNGLVGDARDGWLPFASWDKAVLEIFRVVVVRLVPEEVLDVQLPYEGSKRPVDERKGNVADGWYEGKPLIQDSGIYRLGKKVSKIGCKG